MKLDTENDRNVLLGLIQNATIQGSAVMVIADLVQRIQAAEVDAPVPEEAPAAKKKAAAS